MARDVHDGMFSPVVQTMDEEYVNPHDYIEVIAPWGGRRKPGWRSLIQFATITAKFMLHVLNHVIPAPCCLQKPDKLWPAGMPKVHMSSQDGPFLGVRTRQRFRRGGYCPSHRQPPLPHIHGLEQPVVHELPSQPHFQPSSFVVAVHRRCRCPGPTS